jgi:two-component system response regulator
VEDNPNGLELRLMALAQHSAKAEIAVACDGAAVLDFLFGRGAHADRDIKRQPNLVLLDIRLSKLYGLNIIRSLRAHPLTALIPVVILTSSSQHSDIAECYRIGANGFVRKPVDFRVFSDTLKHMLSFWLDVNETVRSR